MANKSKRNNGFGLIEVMISAMILVTVVGAVVALGSASVRGGLTASDKTTAYNLAQECLEKARAVRDTAWRDSSEAGKWSDNLTDTNLTVECAISGTIGTPPVDYVRTVAVTDVPNASITTITPNPTMKKIDVTVGWTSESGPKTITASEYLTDWKQIN